MPLGEYRWRILSVDEHPGEAAPMSLRLRAVEPLDGVDLDRLELDFPRTQSRVHQEPFFLQTPRVANWFRATFCGVVLGLGTAKRMNGKLVEGMIGSDFIAELVAVKGAAGERTLRLDRGSIRAAE